MIMYLLLTTYYYIQTIIIIIKVGPVRATADGGAELAGDPKLNIFTE